MKLHTRAPAGSPVSAPHHIFIPLGFRTYFNRTGQNEAGAGEMPGSGETDS